MKQKTKNLLHLFLTLCVIGIFIYMDYDLYVISWNTYVRDYALIVYPVFQVCLCLLYGILIGAIFPTREVFLRIIILIPILFATMIFSTCLFYHAPKALGVLNFVCFLALLSLAAAYILSLLKWLVRKAVTFIANQKKQV